MFDGSLAEIDDLASLTDAQVVAAAGGWARAENAAAARKLAAMAELFARRTGLPAAERDHWFLDPPAAVAAELAAAVEVSQALALHQMHRGVALRDRLPQVAALFAAGVISDLLVRAIVWRTYLITDPDALAAVDDALAARVVQWGALSAAKTETEIDALVDEHDPAALRRARASAAGLGVQFGARTDAAGTTSLWARLATPDAALLEQTLEDLARGVCDGDPRGIEERRAAALGALGALGARSTTVACRCAQPDCPHTPDRDTPTKNTIIYVVADEKSLDTTHPNAAAAADAADPTITADAAAADSTDTADAAAAPTDGAVSAPDAAPGAGRWCPPAVVLGAGIVPSALLGAMIERAQIRRVAHPGDTAAEPRYTPSRTLGEFVRCRDLTCRFPGCDKPAQFCDLDHTVAYPLGPTHPSNLKCLCRFHHLLETLRGH
jgi:Domain of unknown function (DUF222)